MMMKFDFSSPSPSRSSRSASPLLSSIKKATAAILIDGPNVHLPNLESYELLKNTICRHLQKKLIEEYEDDFSEYRILFPPKSLQICFTDPQDDYTKNVLGYDDCFSQQDLHYQLRNAGWQVNLAHRKLVDGKKWVAADDVVLAHKANEMCCFGFFESIGISHKPVFLDHLFIVTSDKDHLTTVQQPPPSSLPSSSPITLRHVVLRMPCRELKQYGESVDRLICLYEDEDYKREIEELRRRPRKAASSSFSSSPQQQQQQQQQTWQQPAQWKQDHEQRQQQQQILAQPRSVSSTTQPPSSSPLPPPQTSSSSSSPPAPAAASTSSIENKKTENDDNNNNNNNVSNDKCENDVVKAEDEKKQTDDEEQKTTGEKEPSSKITKDDDDEENTAVAAVTEEIQPTEQEEPTPEQQQQQQPQKPQITFEKFSRDHMHNGQNPLYNERQFIIVENRLVDRQFLSPTLGKGGSKNKNKKISGIWCEQYRRLGKCKKNDQCHCLHPTKKCTIQSAMNASRPIPAPAYVPKVVSPPPPQQQQQATATTPAAVPKENNINDDNSQETPKKEKNKELPSEQEDDEPQHKTSKMQTRRNEKKINNKTQDDDKKKEANFSAPSLSSPPCEEEIIIDVAIRTRSSFMICNLIFQVPLSEIPTTKRRPDNKDKNGKEMLLFGCTEFYLKGTCSKKGTSQNDDDNDNFCGCQFVHISNTAKIHRTSFDIGDGTKRGNGQLEYNDDE